MKKERFFPLDFIRVVSTLFIIVFHFNTSILRHSITGESDYLFSFYPNGNLGQIGVSLFIIISGAALMYTYQSEISLKKFFKKRFVTLYPMYWIAYAIAFLYLFYVRTTIIPEVPKWTFILTIFGMDGMLKYKINNFYILGEWFFGFIIIMYLLFPVLRKMLIEHKRMLIIAITAIYFIIVWNYSMFDISVERNVLTRIPDFVFGMYFVKYMRRVRLFQFIIALSIITLMLTVQLDISQIYKISLMGMSSFIVLTYCAQFINIQSLKKVFSYISKYSFAIFLVHHVTIERLIIRFNGKQLTPIEVICLFLIYLIVTIILSIGLLNLTNKVMQYVKGLKLQLMN